jgi:hypothetical protein
MCTRGKGFRNEDGGNPEESNGRDTSTVLIEQDSSITNPFPDQNPAPPVMDMKFCLGRLH